MSSGPRSVLARRLSVLAAAAASFLPAACSGDASAQDPAKKPDGLEQREATRVRVVPVERREMVKKLVATTVVESENEIQVFPRASGIVTALHVEEGDLVEAGAVLAELDARVQQALVDEAAIALEEARDAIPASEKLVAEAEARVELTKLTWEQAKRDFERNEQADLISVQALEGLRVARDRAEADHRLAKFVVERTKIEAKSRETARSKAELELQRAQLDLSFMRIEAPIAGVIARRSINVGASVSTSTAAFVLTDVEHLRAVLHRPQRELEMFRRALVRTAEGAPLEIRAEAEALPGVEIAGSIRLVSPAIDAQSGSFRVTIDLPSRPDGAADGPRLLPGMLVRLEVVTARHPEALVVPKRALRREGDLALLFLVRDGRAVRVEVDEGFADDESVEVLPRGGARVAPADLVVVVGNRELEDGGEVRVEEPPAAAPDPAPAEAQDGAQPETSAASAAGDSQG